MIRKVNITINEDGLNRPEASKDGYTGLLFRPSTVTGLTVPSSQFYVTSLKQAESYGIILGSPAFGKYHSIIKDFFTGCDYFGKPSKLFIAVGNASDTYKLGLDALMSVSANEVRTVLYPTFDAFDEDLISLISNENNIRKSYNTPVYTIYAPIGMGDGSTVNDFPDLRNLQTSVVDHPSVMVLWGTDQSRVNTYGNPVGPAIGAVAGFMAGNDVATSPANRLKSNNGYADIFGFTEPVLYYSIDSEYINPVSSLWTDSLCSDLDSYGINYFDYVPNKPGVFLSGDANVVTETNDLQSAHLTRPLFKAQRLISSVLENYPESKVRISADGSMSNLSWEVIKNSIKSVLDQMVANEEISGYLDPITTATTNPEFVLYKNVDVQINIRPVESISYINVTMGYAL